jgi:hypothetical protein
LGQNRNPFSAKTQAYKQISEKSQAEGQTAHLSRQVAQATPLADKPGVA